MRLRNDTIRIQEKFASYCRTGKTDHIKGTQPDRMKHYRRLVFNILRDAMETAFPITLSWLSEKDWLLLLNEFHSKHDAQTPSIWKLPLEFVNFVNTGGYAKKLNKPALKDLLVFEWNEIEVHTMTNVEEPQSTELVFSSKSILQINPYHIIQHAEYPIHLLNASAAQNNKGQYYIFIYRTLSDDQVRFIQLSPIHVIYLEKISEKNQSLHELLPVILALLQLKDLKQLKLHLLEFTNDMLQREVLFKA